MNKVLIIPDVHGRDFWINAVNKYKDEVDEIVFLGDYLDPYMFDFENKTEDTILFDTIFNFKQIIEFAKSNNKVKLLIGNHDFHYIYNVYNGSRKILKYLSDILKIYKENLNLFKICHEIYINDNRYIFSHAGIMDKWLVNNNLNREIDINEINSLINNPNILWQVPVSRGGRYYWGSCIWAHASDMLYESENIKKDCFQIFGHTYSKYESIRNDLAMLDCCHAFLLTDENKILKINE